MTKSKKDGEVVKARLVTVRKIGHADYIAIGRMMDVQTGQLLLAEFHPASKTLIISEYQGDGSL